MVSVVLLDEPGAEEPFDPAAPEDGLLELEALPEGSVELPDEPEVAPLLIEALPLAEPESPGVVLLLLEELGGVDMSEEVAEEELGEEGVVVAVGLDDVLLLVPDLLRSQPVTAAVATASTATRGMSLFMTSPFRLRFVV